MRDLINDEPLFASRSQLDDYRILPDHLTLDRLTVASYARRRPDLGTTQANPVSETFMGVVILDPLPAHRGWRNGKRWDRPSQRRGAFAGFDLRESWQVELASPFRTLNLFIPQSAFDALTEELSQPRIELLDCPRPEEILDPFVFSLSPVLLHMLAEPQEVSTLTAHHILSAIRLHVAATHGGLVPGRERASGGLTPWQLRRATEMILGNLQGDVTTDELSAACRLSTRQFQRAFKQEKGVAPHQWQTLQRARRARELIDVGEGSLSEIADACGFADQSHLTRVFQKAFGLPPGAYRRMRRS